MEVEYKDKKFVPVGAKSTEAIFYGYVVKIGVEEEVRYYFYDTLEGVPFNTAFGAEMLYKVEDEQITKCLALGNMRLFMLLYNFLENKEEIFKCGWYLEHKRVGIVRLWIEDGALTVQDIYNKNNLVYFYNVDDMMKEIHWSDEEKEKIRKAINTNDKEVLDSYGIFVPDNGKRIYKKNAQGGLSKEKVKELKKEWNWRHCDTDEKKCENCKQFVNRVFEGQWYRRCGRLSWHYGCFAARTERHKVCDMWEPKEQEKSAL